MSKQSLIFISALLLFSVNLSAEVITDGTLGRIETLSGDFKIGDKLGQQIGSNLFHSFSIFNINKEESATFTGPNSISNIITRVTGGSRSLIDGALNSEIPDANLYLLNPKGILFGENASLNINGSFHASTADYLRLGNNGRFSARQPRNSILTVAPVEAFGFLGNKPTEITVMGENVALIVPEGETLSVIAGNIEMENSVLSAPSGRINLAAMGSYEGEVVPTAFDLQTNVAKGEIKITYDYLVERQQYGNIDVSGATGQVFIRAGQFILDGAEVFADTVDDNNEQKVSIDVAIDGDMELLNGARITADNNSLNKNSQAGDIFIRAETLALCINDNCSLEEEIDFKNDVPPLEYFSMIATDSFYGGDGGDIYLNIQKNLNLINAGAILAATKSGGNAGDIYIDAGEVMLRNAGIISAEAVGFGHAGDITINAQNKITLSQGKDYGNLASTASLNPDGEESNDNFDDSLTAGNIFLNTPILILKNNGYITTYAEQGGGGNISLNVSDRLHITDDSRITAEAFGEKSQDKGGNITIESPDIFELNDSRLLARAYAGNGGKIDITTSDFKISGNSQIDVSSALGFNGEFILNSVKLRDDFLTLPPQKFQHADLSLNRCTLSTEDLVSSFYIITRDTLPTSPTDLRTNLYFSP